MNRPSTIRFILALCLSALFVGTTHAEIVAPSGTKIKNLSSSLRKASIGLPPSPDFEVAQGDAWVLTGDNSIVDLGSGTHVLPKGFVAHSFARTKAGSVVIITESVLGGISQGMFLPTTKLPYGNMRVVAGQGESVLIYGGPDKDQQLISYDGTSFSPLISIAEPIDAVTHAADRVFFSTKNKVYTAKWGEAPGLVFMFPDDSQMITGMAVDTASGVIYVATKDAVFALNQGMAFKKLQGVGGRLQFSDDVLYVLDSAQGLFASVRFPK